MKAFYAEAIKKRDYILPLFLWIIVCISFIAFRKDLVLVWNDSVTFYGYAYVKSFQELSFFTIVYNSFSYFTSEGYRPLSEIINLLSLEYFRKTNLLIPPIWFLFIVANFYALLALTVYYVAKRIINNSLLAYLTSFFVVLSSPVISASWVLFAGIQPIVTIIICLGLLLYWKAIDHPEKYWPLICLGFVMLIGPWFREFCGVLPIIILFSELMKKGKNIKIIVLSIIFLFHAFFPMFCMAFIFRFHHLPGLQPVFLMGNLQIQLNQSSGFSLLHFLNSIRWQMPPSYLAIIPPSLIVLFQLSYFTYFILQMKSQLKNKFVLFKLSIPVMIYLMLLAYSLKRHDMPLLCLVLSLSIVLVPVNLPLRLWFLLAYLPFLKIYTEITHLAYVLVPSYIIILKSIADFFRIIGNIGKAKIAKIVFSFFLMIAALDQLATAYGSYTVTRNTYHGILSMASWIKNNLPRHSAIICNAIHVLDIQLFSDNYFTAYSTMDASGGFGFPDKILDTPEKLMVFLDKKNIKNVYLLDVDFNYLPEQRVSHQHKFIHQYSLPSQDLGLIYTIYSEYPFIDPLRYLVSRQYLSFLSAPDLAQDFYNGSSLRHHKFTNALHANYHLYKITGSAIKLRPFANENVRQLINSTLQAVWMNHYGYNVVYSPVTKKFYAISQSAGPFDILLCNNKNEICISRESKLAVINYINHKNMKNDRFT